MRGKDQSNFPRIRATMKNSGPFCQTVLRSNYLFQSPRKCGRLVFKNGRCKLHNTVREKQIKKDKAYKKHLMDVFYRVETSLKIMDPQKTEWVYPTRLDMNVIMKIPTHDLRVITDINGEFLLYRKNGPGFFTLSEVDMRDGETTFHRYVSGEKL